MKIVEGHLDMLRMYREMSVLSDSFASKTFRKYIDMLDRAISIGFGDVLPRSVKVTPVVNKRGEMNTDFIMPDAESGRIVSTSS